MNILFYTEYNITPNSGGIGRVTAILTDYFRRHFNWKVYSIYSAKFHRVWEITNTDGSIQLRLHDRFGLRRNVIANYTNAAEYIINNKIDIVIIQSSMEVSKRLKQILIKQKYGVRIITCLHFTPGTDVFLTKLSDVRKVGELNRQSLKTIIKALLSPIYNSLIIGLTKRGYRWAYRYSDKILVLSDAYKDMFRRFSGIEDKTKLLAMPNPLSFSENFKEEDWDNKQHTALVVGRLSEYEKRISVILAIWGEYEKYYPESDWKLVIVGEGISLNDYMKQAENLGLKRCYFEGYQSPIDYYRRSKLFLMTSAFEGFPMTLIEAQQCGCVPIVMNSFVSLPEIVTNDRNGIIVNSGDKGEFLSTMLSLMDDPERLKYLAKNSINDCMKYSKNIVCEQWKKMIEELVK